MLKLVSVLFLFNLTLQDDHWEVCTDEAKKMVDDVFDLAKSLEKDPYSPSPDAMKSFMGNLEDFLGDCANVHVQIKQYEHCVDDIMPVFPEIKRLV